LTYRAKVSQTADDVYNYSQNAFLAGEIVLYFCSKSDVNSKKNHANLQSITQMMGVGVLK